MAETNERMLKENETQLESQQQELLHLEAEDQQEEDLSEEIQKLNLQIARNKTLLEQEHLKLEELKGDFLNKTQQRLKIEKLKQLKMENEKLIRKRTFNAQAISELESRIETLSDDDQDDKINCKGYSSLSPSAPASTSNGGGGNRFMAIIPSDLQSSSAGQMTGESQGRHVAEYDWKGRELSGKFTGWLDSNGNPNGHGTLRMADESVFDGDWRHGDWTGDGVYKIEDGDIYRGAWKDGKQHGRGVYVWSDGCIYVGDYVAGNRQGKGIMTWPYGAKYEGDFQNDRRNGRGVYNYPDGRCYTGQYKDDRRHGMGAETAADGTILYSGNWSDGEFIDG